MTTLAAPAGNEIQNTLAASYTRGTDTTITLVDGTEFANSAHVVRISNVGNTKWCLIIYTTKATHVLTMGGGATDYALAKNVSVGDEAYEWPIGSNVDVVGAADEIAQLFSEQADKIDADGTVPLTDDWDIGNGRYIATDKIRARDGDGLLLEDDGGNGIAIADGGIITIAKQSAARAFMTGGAAAQAISTGAWKRVLLTAESFDIQEEFDISVIDGTSDGSGNASTKVVDTGAFTEDEAFYLTMAFYNITDGLYGEVTAKVSDNELTIGTGGGNSKVYKLYHCKFTAKAAGIYQVSGGVYYESPEADKRIQVGIYKNGSQLALSVYHTSNAALMISTITNIVQLAATDYLDLRTIHTCSGTETLYGDTNTFLAVAKIA